MNSNLASPKMKKSVAGRGGSGRTRPKITPNAGQTQQQALAGLYQNNRLVNTVYSVVGCNATVTGKSGKQYEGVFRTISPEGSLALGKVNQVEEQRQNGVVDSSVQKQDHCEQFIMKKKDWVIVEFKDVNLEECYFSPKKDVLKTDNAISKKQNDQEKELEKWDHGDVALETPGLESGSAHTVTNGWSADQMFAINEKKYGVKSTYNEDMEEYTTKLEKSDTPEYREKEKFAAQKADEIIKESPFERNMVDSGRSEETLYSSVVRSKPDRSTPQNWRNPNADRSDKEQKSQKVRREGSSSPAMTKREPLKTAQVEEVHKIKVREKVVKQETEDAVESKPEVKVEVPTEAVKDSKPLQNDSSGKSEPSPTNHVANQTSPKVAVETTECPVVPSKSPVTTPPPPVEQKEIMNKRDNLTKELKTFGTNFKLAEKKVEENAEEKKAKDEKISKGKKTEEKEEPQPTQEPKVDPEPTSAEKKINSTLNPNAQAFRPAKRSTPSPISTPPTGGAPSPFQNPYGVPSVYQPNYPRHMPRGRAPRGEYMDHGFVNASNVTGQPFFTQPITQYVHQHQPPANMAFMAPGNMRHPGIQPHHVFLQPGQGPMVMPMGPPGAFQEGPVYYNHHGPMQLIQSPPQITSPSLQQHQFNFSSQPMSLNPQAAAAVRPVGQAVITPSPHQTVVLMRQQAPSDMPPQIMAQNRQAQNFQGN